MHLHAKTREKVVASTLTMIVSLISARASFRHSAVLHICMSPSCPALLPCVHAYQILPSPWPAPCSWPTYMQLISASLASMIKDNSIPRYMSLVRDIHDSSDLDALMHKLMQHFRVVLGHTNNHHVWYRVSLTASTNTAATIFDDLTQVRRHAAVM